MAKRGKQSLPSLPAVVGAPAVALSGATPAGSGGPAAPALAGLAPALQEMILRMQGQTGVAEQAKATADAEAQAKADADATAQAEALSRQQEIAAREQKRLAAEAEEAALEKSRAAEAEAVSRLSAFDRENPNKLSGDALDELAWRHGLARSQIQRMRETHGEDAERRIREQVKYLIHRQPENA